MPQIDEPEHEKVDLADDDWSTVKFEQPAGSRNAPSVPSTPMFELPARTGTMLAYTTAPLMAFEIPWWQLLLMLAAGSITFLSESRRSGLLLAKACGSASIAAFLVALWAPNFLLRMALWLMIVFSGLSWFYAKSPGEVDSK